MRKLEIVAYGALGGMCPSLAKLAGSFSANPDQAMPIIGVYVALFLFAVLGAIVSLGFGTQEVRAAIVAGIAAPAIVTNVLAGVENRNGQSAALLAQPAIAQTAGNATLLQGAVRPGQIYVTITPVGASDQRVRTPLVYQWVSNGRAIDQTGGAGELSLSGAQSVLMPDGATALLVNNREIPVDEIRANSYSIDLNVKTRPTIGGDLIWGLGGTRSFVIQSVDVGASK
ncbi:MAG: hypothetical protein AAGA08_13650 [Pseudomonadota bacterium]